MRPFLRRVWYAIRQRQFEADLAEEFEFHRTMKQEELEARGNTPADAERATRRAFGSLALAHDHVRDVWTWSWLQDLSQDVRFATRLLAKDRRFTLAAVVALALGIGAMNTAFTAVNAFMIRGLPLDRPEQIVALRTFDTHGRELGSSDLDYQDWRQATRTFVDMAAELGAPMTLTEEGRAAERVQASYITVNLFRLLGRAPMLGRDFLPEDERPGAPPVVILGHAVWRTLYVGDPTVIGRTIRVNDRPSTVIGVMPERFTYPFFSEVWQPLSLASRVTTSTRDMRRLSVFARLADTVTMTQAQAELTAIAQRLAQAYPDTNTDITPTVTPLKVLYLTNGSDIRPTLLIMMGVISVVLLITCVNVATLLLARSAGRLREIAIRASLGATRWRIVRQGLVDSALLVALASALGLGLSVYGVRLVSTWYFDPSQGVTQPDWMDWTMDWRVYTCLAAVCLVASVVCGLAPALHLSKITPNDTLKDRTAAGGVRARRWTSALIVVELALTLPLLAGGGLMFRSVLAVDRAVRVIASGLTTMRVDLPTDRYRTPQQRSAFFGRLETRLGAMPGIASATMTSHVPFTSNSGFIQPLTIEGRSLIVGERPPRVSSIYVGARYFETLELGLLRGRLFTDADGTAGHDSAIVNQRFATEFFASGDPIGHRIQLRDGTWFTIVGVSPTVPNLSTIQTASSGLEPVVYLPMRGQPIPGSSTRLIVRGGSGFAAVTAQVRETVRTLDADLPLFMVFSMERISTNTTQSLLSVLFGFLAVVALGLDSVVVYAVAAQGVTARIHEIGVRLALGAQEPHVMWLFVRRTLVQLGIGLTIGIGGALALGTLLQSFLVQTGARDSLTLVLVSALLVVVAMMACVFPARRAAKLDPVSALRHE